MDYVALIFASYCLVVSVTNIWFLRRYSIPDADVLLDDDVLVSVLIPARNESESIGACIQSIAGQTYKKLEIIVLDDRSSDNTLEIVQQQVFSDNRIKVIVGEDSPGGWIGKHWACHQLSKIARGTHFIFVDADTVMQPNAISDALKLSKQSDSDLVTFIPYRMRSCMSEYLIFPFIDWIIISWLPILIGRLFKYSFLSVSFGQFILLKKQVYFSSGGHKSIKNIPTDDIELGRRVKRAGYKWGLYDGTKLLETRSYATDKQAIIGISRSVFPALNHSVSVLLIFSFALLMLGFYPGVVLVLETLDHGISLTDKSGIAIITFSMLVGSWLVVTKGLSHHYWATFFYPISFLVMIAIAFHSMVLYSMGHAVWKGRSVKVRKIRL